MNGKRRERKIYRSFFIQIFIQLLTLAVATRPATQWNSIYPIYSSSSSNIQAVVFHIQIFRSFFSLTYMPTASSKQAAAVAHITRQTYLHMTIVHLRRRRRRRSHSIQAKSIKCSQCVCVRAWASGGLETNGKRMFYFSFDNKEEMFIRLPAHTAEIYYTKHILNSHPTSSGLLKNRPTPTPSLLCTLFLSRKISPI